MRTLQRHIASWRARHGPNREVMFPQLHEPGEAAQSDFTYMNSLGVTLGGVAFPHLVYHLFRALVSRSGHNYFGKSADSFGNSAQSFQQKIQSFQQTAQQRCKSTWITSRQSRSPSSPWTSVIANVDICSRTNCAFGQSSETRFIRSLDRRSGISSALRQDCPGTGVSRARGDFARRPSRRCASDDPARCIPK